MTESHAIEDRTDWALAEGHSGRLEYLPTPRSRAWREASRKLRIAREVDESYGRALCRQQGYAAFRFVPNA